MRQEPLQLSGDGSAGPGSGSTLLGPAEVREVVTRLGFSPTKQLGQNFVIDPNTIRRIVRAARLRPDDVVMEIGPGVGSLTLGLLDAASAVVAIEVDRTLAAALPDTLAARAPNSAHRCHVVRGDARTLGPGDLSGPTPTALVANLPYNVAVPVLLHVLEVFTTVRHALVMVQSEVAERLAAPPGNRIYGVPSVKARWYADVRRAGTVGRSVFWPAPHVGSGLVELERHEPPRTTASRQQVFAVVDHAFAQRRKTLRAALAGWAGSPGAAERLLRVAGVDPTARGEALTVTEFARIAEAGISR